MKKLLILFSLVLSVCSAQNISAQNANRSGFFIEAGAGFVMGDRPVTNLNERDDIIEIPSSSSINGSDSFNLKIVRKKKATYGLGANLGLGYRWATSNHFAFDVKAKFSDATYRFSETLLCSVSLGLRYISSEFSGNKSIYANIGVGGGMFIDESKAAIPYEAGVGINFSNRFYSGFSWDAQYSTADKWVYGKHYGTFGIKFGFRI